METDLIARQANKLIESVYRMEVEEQKLILLATKKVNDLELQGLPFTPETEVVITADEFAKAYGIPKQRAFEALIDAKNTIYDRSFEMDYIDTNGVKKPISSRWIHAKGEMKNKSEVSMFFTPAVIPFIYLVVKEEFTLMDLKEVGRLKSKYAVRLYQLLMKWRNAEHQPTFTIENLRNKLGLEETEYLQLGDFNKRVIQVAVQQINLGTGFVELKAVPKKEGRKIISFRFEYKKYDNETINVTAKPVKSATTSNKGGDDDEGNPIKQKPIKPKTGQNKPVYDESNNYGYTDHLVSKPQAMTFSSKIIQALVAKEAEVDYLRSKAGRGESFPKFREEIIIDLMAGDVKPYAKALRFLGYVQYPSRKKD